MTMKRLFVIASGLVLAGCAEQPTPAPEVPVAKAPAVDEGPKGAADASSGEPYEATVGGFKFRVPADWQQKPPKSDFILGEFSIPGEAGAARLTVSSAGGGIEANVERWRGQFNPGPDDPEPRESEISLDGHKGTLVELAGTFTDMFGGGTPNASWRMLGVAVPIGETNFFLKLTGPAKTVTPRRDEFLKFVDSARMEK